jgi:hypothetical protein
MADDLMPQGALSAVAASQDDPTSELPASLIDQDKYARNAYFAGLIAPTKSGHFSESLSNAMDSENKIAMQAAQLRAQYLPLVAQAKMQRDLQRAQIQNYQSESALRQLEYARNMRMQKMAEDLLSGGTGGGGAPEGSAFSLGAPSQPSAFPNGSGMNLGGLRQVTAGPSGPAPGMGVDPRALAFDFAFNGGKNVASMINDRTKPTDEQKNYAWAYPEPGAAQVAARGKFDAATIAPLRAGAPFWKDGRVQFTPGTAPEGFVNTQNPDGSFAVAPVKGALEAVEASTRAKGAGKAAFELKEVYDPRANGGTGGQVVQTVRNVATAAGVPGSPSEAAIVQTESGGNPAAVSPKGAIGAWQVMPNTVTDPGFGVQPAKDKSPAELDRVGREYFGAMSQRYGSPTLGAIAYNMGPKATEDWLKKGAKFEDLPAETRHYVGKVSTLTALNSLPTSDQVAAPSTGEPMPAAPPAGQTEFRTATAQGAAKRTNSLIEQAADSATRVNVLDNVINLSQQGVATGPSQEWRNKAKGIAADTLGIKSWKDDVSGFSEMKKFLQQNAQRAWTAAGGTGTDAQLDAAMKANPNDTMFPQALQTMAKWAKAGELALQAKANAMQSEGINSPDAQAKFEQKWRGAFDPRAFQMALMAPEEARQFASKQTDRAQLIEKVRALKLMGAL